MTALSKTYVYTNIHTNAQEKVLKEIDWRAAIFFFSEGSESKYFRLWRPLICHNSSSLLLPV